MRALWVLCMLVTEVAAANSWELALDRERTPLLESHLTIRLPIGMVVQPAEVDQTRADLEIDGGRFVMTAYETYQSPGTDLEAGTTKEIRRQGGALARARVDELLLPALSAVAVYPALSRTSSDPNLVLAVYVDSGDDTVQVLAFYVVGTALQNKHAWAELAKRMASTLGPSTGHLHGYAGLLGVGARRLRIECRDDCRIRVSGTGYQLRPMVPLGHTQMCTLDDGPSPARRSKRQAGRVLGRDVVWSEWKDGTGVHATTMVPIDDDAHVRIACEATTRSELDAVRAVVEAMTLDP